MHRSHQPFWRFRSKIVGEPHSLFSIANIHIYMFLYLRQTLTHLYECVNYLVFHKKAPVTALKVSSDAFLFVYVYLVFFAHIMCVSQGHFSTFVQAQVEADLVQL